MDTPAPTPAPKQGRSPTPFFESLKQEMDQMLDRFRDYPALNQFGLHMGGSGQVIPAVDIVDTEDSLEITAEVPGVEEDDLDVTLNGDMLILSGTKKNTREEKEANYLMFERSYGSFRRQIPLGFTPDDDAVKAQFDGGLLRLTIAKPAAVKQNVRKIDIGKK